MLPKFDISSTSVREVIITSVLHQSGNRVKTKSQKVLGASYNVCRSYRGKIGRGAFQKYQYLQHYFVRFFS